MRKDELIRLLEEAYGARPEQLWAAYPSYAAFRRQDNQKWFALLMTVPAEKLGVAGAKDIDLVNVKCGPAAVGSFRTQAGVFPARYMDKNSWVALALDGSADDGMIRMLLDMSYTLTGSKPQK